VGRCKYVILRRPQADVRISGSHYVILSVSEESGWGRLFPLCYSDRVYLAQMFRCAQYDNRMVLSTPTRFFTPLRFVQNDNTMEIIVHSRDSHVGRSVLLRMTTTRAKRYSGYSATIQRPTRSVATTAPPEGGVWGGVRIIKRRKPSFSGRRLSCHSERSEE